MPFTIGQASSCELPYGILIAGYDKKELFCYYPIENDYKEIVLTPFAKNCSKLLLRFKDFVFCLTNKQVFKTDLKLSQWAEVNSSLPEKNWNTLMSPIVIKNKIYFIKENFSLWSFSVENYSVILENRN